MTEEEWMSRSASTDTSKREKLQVYGTYEETKWNKCETQTEIIMDEIVWFYFVCWLFFLTKWKWNGTQSSKVRVKQT